MSEEELRAEIARINEQLERLGGGMTPASRAINDLGRSAGLSADAIDDVTAGARQAGYGLISFYKNLGDGNKSMVKYGQSLNQLFSGVGDILMTLGPLGMAFGVLSKVIGALTQGVLEYDQAYLDAYDKLAEFGYAGTNVADNLKDLAMATGYNSGKILKLAEITNRLGTDLTSFGKTAGLGQEYFIEIAKVGAETRERFLRLGISQEELTSIQADYLKQQSKLTMFTVKDQAMLRENSKRYAETLVELSALTGKSRPELQSAMNEQLQDYKYQAWLQGQIATKGQDYVDNMNKAMTDISASLDPSFAKGMREIVATGVAQGEEANVLQVATNGEIFKWADDFKKGKMTQDELIQALRDKVQQNRKMLAGVPLTDKLLRMFGMYGDALQNSVKKRDAGTSAMVESQMEAAELPNPDDLKKTQHKRIESEIAMQGAYDTLIQFISGPVNYALRGLFTAVTYFAKGIAKLVPGKSGKELERILMDSEGLSSAYKDKQKELIDLEKAKQAGKSHLSDPTRFGRELIEDIEKGKPFVRVEKLKTIEEQIESIKKELDEIRSLYRIKEGKDIDKQSSVASPRSSGSQMGDGEIKSGSKMFDQGIMSGPDSGYLSGMTGMQAVVPLPNGKSIQAIVKLPQQLQNRRNNPLLESDSINSFLQNYAKAIPNITASLVNQVTTNQSDRDTLSDDMIMLIASKMDTLIDNLRRNNDYQNDLLAHVKK